MALWRWVIQEHHSPSSLYVPHLPPIQNLCEEHQHLTYLFIYFLFFKVSEQNHGSSSPYTHGCQHTQACGPRRRGTGRSFPPLTRPSARGPAAAISRTEGGRAPGGLRAEDRPQVCPCHRAVPQPPQAACGEGGQGGGGGGGAAGGEMGWGRQRPAPCSGTEGTAAGSGGLPAVSTRR